jgi:anti-anti-sigma factor
MKLKNTFGQEDFAISMADCIPVLKFNMFRATINESKAFQQHLIHLMSSNRRFIIIDFTDCVFIDSTIAGVMVTLAKDFRKNKGDFILVTPPGAISKLFSQTGLDHIFKRFDSLTSALASINP